MAFSFSALDPRRLWNDPAWRPDLSRAARVTVAFMTPLLLAQFGALPLGAASLAAIAAESLALIEVRGPYSVRLFLFSAIALIYAGAGWAGAAAGGSLAAAVLAMGVIAALSGLWRHLSSDCGMSVGIATCVLYLIALAAPFGGIHHTESGLAVLAGCGFAVALQVALWPVRAQQPLRRLVSESWLAVADLAAALEPAGPGGAEARAARVASAEARLRDTVDKGAAALALAGGKRRPEIVARLEELNLAAARLATRLVVLETALETLTLAARPEFRQFRASLDAALETLDHMARAIARAALTRQPGHVALCEVRMRRAGHLIEALETRLAAVAGDAPEPAQTAALMRQIRELLPATGAALRAAVERAGERAATPLELPELAPPSLRPLAATLNLRGRVDPALPRYAARLAALMMLGVGVYRGWGVPRGYWLPLTIVIVLQPDYGSTRRRAGQRLFGTLAGGALAAAVLWLRFPAAALNAALAVSIFCFAVSLRRSYTTAVFFITLMLALLLRSGATPTAQLVAERLACTVAGGLLALLAALLFWPAWERSRFPPLLAQALRAGHDYLATVTGHLVAGGAYDDAVIAAKRRAETANSAVFTSLQRMYGDPENQRERIEQDAALANGNQRLARLMTAVAVALPPAQPVPPAETRAFAELAGASLNLIAGGAESGAPDPAGLAALLKKWGDFRWPDPPGALPAQLPRAGTELIAMLAAAQEK